MVERLSKRRILSDAIQGEGSYVVITRLSVGDVKALRMQRKDSDIDPYEANLSLIASHVLEWNWVDYDGNPLPNPQENPEVVDTLSQDEADFLSDAVAGTVQDSKN